MTPGGKLVFMATTSATANIAINLAAGKHVNNKLQKVRIAGARLLKFAKTYSGG